MKQIDAATRVRTIVGVTAGVLLVISFALLGTLIFRQQANVGPGASGCPSTSGKVASSIVGASFSVSASTATYTFDSLVDRSPSSGVPGLVAYCVYYSGSDPTSVTPSAVGADSTPFGAGAPPPSGSFSFNRGGGNATNIELDGTTGITMGTATWSGSVSTPQTILLHINDATECHNLYGVDTSDSCFVFPSSGQTPTPTNTPAGVPTPTNTPAGVPTPTNTPGPNDPTATPTTIPTPTGTPHPK